MEILFTEWWGIAGLVILLLLLIKGVFALKYLMAEPAEDESDDRKA